VNMLIIPTNQVIQDRFLAFGKFYT